VRRFIQGEYSFHADKPTNIEKLKNGGITG
jgi:hypothetical protein